MRDQQADRLPQRLRHVDRGVAIADRDVELDAGRDAARRRQRPGRKDQRGSALVEHEGRGVDGVRDVVEIVDARGGERLQRRRHERSSRPSSGQASNDSRQLCVISARRVCASTWMRAPAISAAITSSSSEVSTRRKAFASASDSGSTAGAVRRMEDMMFSLVVPQFLFPLPLRERVSVQRRSRARVGEGSVTLCEPALALIDNAPPAEGYAVHRAQLTSPVAP